MFEIFGIWYRDEPGEAFNPKISGTSPKLVTKVVVSKFFRAEFATVIILSFIFRLENLQKFQHCQFGIAFMGMERLPSK